MKLRVIDKNIVAERITGIEGDADHVTQRVERTDITTDAINCIIGYLGSQDKFDKDGYVFIPSDDVILCLMNKNEFTLVKNDVLETYKNNTVELEKTKQELAELQAKLNYSQETQNQEVIDGEFTETE
jgi:folate-dependent tRNA-U54 methylase TrmFO/GidA